MVRVSVLILFLILEEIRVNTIKYAVNCILFIDALYSFEKVSFHSENAERFLSGMGIHLSTSAFSTSIEMIDILVFFFLIF